MSQKLRGASLDQYLSYDGLENSDQFETLLYNKINTEKYMVVFISGLMDMRSNLSFKFHGRQKGSTYLA